MLPLNKRKFFREYVALGSVSRIIPPSRTTGPVQFFEDANRINNTGRVQGPTSGNLKESELPEEAIEPEDFEAWALRPLVSPIPKVPSSHNATKVTHNVDPWGLPKKMTLKEYRANPVCHLSAFNYKVNAKVGATRADQKYVLSVLDTGAGPNLIREGCCPPAALEGTRRQTSKSLTLKALRSIGSTYLEWSF